MDEISTQKNLNLIENTVTSKKEFNKAAIDNTEQPSEKAIQTILNYSKSLCVLKSRNSNKTKLCNIN